MRFRFRDFLQYVTVPPNSVKVYTCPVKVRHIYFLNPVIIIKIYVVNVYKEAEICVINAEIPLFVLLEENLNVMITLLH